MASSRADARLPWRPAAPQRSSSRCTSGRTAGGTGGAEGSGPSTPSSMGGAMGGLTGSGGGSQDGPRPSTASDAGSSAAMTPDATVITVPLGVLPVIFIDVPGKTPDTLPQPNSEKVTGTIKFIEDHDGTHKNIATRPPSVMLPIGITLRGSSSTGFAQKSFSIEFRDASGQEVFHTFGIRVTDK